MSALQRFGDSVWICDGPRVRMLTIPFSTRMTIVELGQSKLWIHSPVSVSAALQDEIDALGTVAFIVAPNKIHSLGINAWAARYPNAEVWVSPRFCERHQLNRPVQTLGVESKPDWCGAIEYHCFAGSGFLDEVVFYHKRSKTLIITDLIQRHEAESETWFWRKVKQAIGALGPSGGTPLDLRSTFNDLNAAQASVSRVLRWDFTRVVIAHGSCITTDAHNSVDRALAWTKPKSPEKPKR